MNPCIQFLQTQIQFLNEPNNLGYVNMEVEHLKNQGLLRSLNLKIGRSNENVGPWTALPTHIINVLLFSIKILFISSSLH